MISSATEFSDFLNAFFRLFAQKGFRRAGFRGEYLSYLNSTDAQRTGDEAKTVDTAIVGPLLGLLGFEPAEHVYNEQRSNGRPDFAPNDAIYGTCFIVEDKSTSQPLTFDLADPDSHLAQLAGYVRSQAVRLGWLTNGKQFTVWRFDDPNHPERIIDFDIPAAIREWNDGASVLSDSDSDSDSDYAERALRDLFDLCRKASFSDSERIERELAVDPDTWQRTALPLGTGSGNEPVLVEALQALIMELQRDARRVLTTHLDRYAAYADTANRLSDDATEQATEQLDEQRRKALAELDPGGGLLGLKREEREDIELTLSKAVQDELAFDGPKSLLTSILAVINQARVRKYANRPRSARPWFTLDELPPFQAALQIYSDNVFAWHQRRANLRQIYRADIAVYDDYTVWVSLVKETMLGGLTEDQRREEFALQAAYVVFIRLLLIRVCEDKGIFPNRFVSDGGLKHWQEDIQRYLFFANGNPYDPLLDMAYKNAQNIYSHFFTGRELFNWYRLDRRRLMMALHQLSRFNFAGVDSDIVGTIYNTYVKRNEKKEKGQFYTPPVIVDYILDNVGYTSGAEIIGPNKRLIDPACGNGTFLVRAARRLVSAYQGTNMQVDDPIAVLERVQNSLFGFDLNPFACYLSEVNLLIQVLDLVKLAHNAGKRPALRPFHIYNVDALARPAGRYYYAHFNTLMAEENKEVDQIKRREPGTPYASGFAFVVANPPYGAKLSDAYKDALRSEWADVFHGQPDTYVFFFKLGIELLAANGRLGFITPNTYLMGTNTAALRGVLLSSSRIEQIVDLPQGIWADANVDCVLLFLAAESDEQRRRAQQAQINLLGLRDTLDKLEQRQWRETLSQRQSLWLDNPRNEINIRYDELLQQIESACRIVANNHGTKTRIQRLGDVTDSSQGIIPLGLTQLSKVGGSG